MAANGFRFAARCRMEDMDATRGFRKTMASLGVAGGRVVRPRLSLARGALVGVRDFVMPRASLAAVGFPAAEELHIDGVAYNASEPIGTYAPGGCGRATPRRVLLCTDWLLIEAPAPDECMA